MLAVAAMTADETGKLRSGVVFIGLKALLSDLRPSAQSPDGRKLLDCEADRLGRAWRSDGKSGRSPPDTLTSWHK
jgi:hypothetical protein